MTVKRNRFAKTFYNAVTTITIIIIIIYGNEPYAIIKISIGNACGVSIRLQIESDRPRRCSSAVRVQTDNVLPSLSLRIHHTHTHTRVNDRYAAAAYVALNMYATL
jgi:hypothetical protein